jgi:hypothetical protein
VIEHLFTPISAICSLPTVPPTGVEPAHPPPEGGALSTELRGHIFEVLADLEQFGKPSKGISERIST